jgi:hypothetical protein
VLLSPRVQILNKGSGWLYATAILVLLAVLIIFIAPEIDLEDGVLRMESLLFVLLVTASIVVITIQLQPCLCSLQLSLVPLVHRLRQSSPVAANLLC